MGKKLFILILLLCTISGYAQRYEVGGSLGGSNYSGDIGSSTLIIPNAPSIGFIYKYNKNPRISYRGSITIMKLIANDSESNNEIRQGFDISINKTITEFTAGIDFNFLEYQISHWKKAKTPYLIFELAAFQYLKIVDGTLKNPTYTNSIGIALPFGAGYKAQITDNIVVGFEVKVRYSFTDDLDDSQFIKQSEEITSNPENAKFGNSITNDWYAFTGFTFTYTFGRPLYYTTRKTR